MTPTKALTHDYRSPLQGGAPIWDGKTLPYTLPAVKLDTSEDECAAGAAGWSYCDNPGDALRIAGMWPDGWPSVLFHVEPGADAIKRGNKCRASTLTLTAVYTDDEVRAAIRAFSEMFGDMADEMAEQQWLWREALGRPSYDAVAVPMSLREALSARGLDWSVLRYDGASAVRAWVGDARTARTARTAWAAWAAWAARERQGNARAAWAAWDAGGAAWAAWAAWDARTALTVYYAARRSWVDDDALLLTAGIRDAYRNGLAIALPVGDNKLGWAMIENEAPIGEKGD